MAVDNNTKTGRRLNTSEEEYLRHILYFQSGWSATTPAHHDDSWVHYIKHQFRHIENLHPILDDMTWPEEISLLPPAIFPGGPGELLLANSTMFYFYIYDPEILFRAGSTLEEVYWGLREWKWVYQNPPEERWEMESDCGEEYDQTDYFPMWENKRDSDGRMSYYSKRITDRMPLHY